MAINDRQKLEAFYLLMNTAPVLNLSSVESLIEAIGDPVKLWNLSQSDINNLDIDKKEKEKLAKKLSETTLEELNKIISSIDANIAVYSDGHYPKKLNRYKYQPLMLFYRGDLNLVDQKRVIAVVGTRKSSYYGEQVVEQLVREISLCKYPVISGTALGIDSKALEASLNAGNKCISVLSTGIDCISPKQSQDLLDTIVEKGGCYLTEFPPGVAAFKSNYPIRAKLLAALASEVIVVEAPDKSGALLVAEEAFNLNRNVFCIPSYFYDKNFWGSHSLIESNKAILLKGFKDVAAFVRS